MTLFYWLLGLIPHVIIRHENGQPYMTRYYLLGGPRDGEKPRRWNLYLHCFHTDDHRTPHNHPWAWAYSLILWGSYVEWRLSSDCTAADRLGPGRLCPGGGHHIVDRCRVFRALDVNRLDDKTFHRVDLLTKQVWTLFLSGPRVQEWGFTEDGGKTVVPAAEWVERNLPGGTTTAKKRV